MAHAPKFILAALVMAGLWFFVSGPAQDQVESQTHVDQMAVSKANPLGLPASQAATNPALSCEFKRGDTLAFSLSQASRFTIDPTILMSDDASQKNPFQPQRQQKTLKTDGWLWRVIDKSNDVWTIAAILDAPQWAVDAKPVDAVVKAGLKTPLLFKMDSACQVTKIGFQAKTPPAAVLEHQMALMMSQLVVRKNETAWTVSETDTLGRYKAAYRRRDRDVTRNKSEYVAVKRPNPRLKMTARIEKGTSSGRLKDNGRWYQRVNVTDHVIVSATAGTFADVETTIDIDAVAPPKDHPFFSMALDLGAYRFVDAHEVAQSKRKRFAGQGIPGLGQRDFKSVMTEFGALLNSGDNGLREKALKLLVQYLRLDPTHVAELMDSLRDGRFPTHAQSAAFLALELAGGTAVHTALRAAMDDPALSRVNRLRAVTAYADSRDATDGFLQELVKIESRAAGAGDGDMQRSTHLALGTLGGNDSLSKEARAEVRDLLTKRLEQASDVTDITTSLAALSNQGDGRSADVVKPYLDSEHPAVRNAAYGALQQMEQLPPTEEMLDDLVTETSPGVQKRIAESLGKNRDDLGESNIEKAIAMMLDPRTQNEVILVGLIDLLGPVSAQNGQARQALVSLFRRTRNVTIIQRIGRYVPAQELQ